MKTEQLTIEQESITSDNINKVFELTPNSSAILKEVIQQSHGRIRLIVHPYYDFSVYNTSSYGIPLQRILGSSNEKSLPIIIMEEEGRVNEVTKYLRNDRVVSETIKNKLYWILTYDSDPRPLFNETTDLSDEDADWQRLLTALKELGVKEILLGGQSLDAQEEKLGKPSEMSWGRCVNEVKIRLSTDFNVRLSNIVYPPNKLE